MRHTFLKHALWAALFAAGAALAQDAAISGADFTHGKADAQLAAVGSQAAADGDTVVVTAPTYWQAKVAAKIRAGAHGKLLTIRFSNGFYENVLVRTEAPAIAEAAARPKPKPIRKPQARPEPKVAAQAEPAAQAKPETKVAKIEAKPEITAASKLEPKPAPRSAPAQPAEQPHAMAVAPMQAPTQKVQASTPPQPAPQVASNIVSVPQVSQQPAVVPIPTTAINSTAVPTATPRSPSHPDSSVRQRLLAALNEGRPAMGALTEAQLRPGDQVYTDGDVLAVVRLDGLYRSLYWLQGPVDLQRVQYMPQGGGHYEVTGSIDLQAPAVHRSAAGAHVVVSDVPAAGSAARARLEQQYNNGQAITGSLAAASLQPEDRLLVDGDAVIIARREGNSMARYWLSGSIDLGQTGIQKLNRGVYRVTGNSLH